jgi:D-hexose-6-phosphate mutarotase
VELLFSILGLPRATKANAEPWRQRDALDAYLRGSLGIGKLSSLPGSERAAGNLDVLIKYVFEARKPEAEFHNDGLRTSHRALVEALSSYIDVSATERVPVQGSHDVYVITTKANSALGHIEDYDAKYSDQVDAIRNAVNKVWATWTQYARLAKLFRVA